MPSPFPGMNPYLESPEMWLEVHHRLITAVAIALQPQIFPKYRVAIEKRTYLSDGESLLIGIPDISVLSPTLPPEAIESSSSSALSGSITVTLLREKNFAKSYSVLSSSDATEMRNNFMRYSLESLNSCWLI